MIFIGKRLQFAGWRGTKQLVKQGKDVLTVSPATYESLQQSGFTANTPQNVDIRENPLVSQVIESKTIDLQDPRIKPRSVSLHTRTSLNLPDEFVQADLGDIKLYGSNQVLLSDIDPENVPRDKDIILTAKKGRLTAIGRVQEGGDEKVNRQMFIEEGESWKVRVTWKTYLKALFLLPGLYFTLLYLQTTHEHYTVSKVYRLLDTENKSLLDTIKALPLTIPSGRESEIAFYGSSPTNPSITSYK